MALDKQRIDALVRYYDQFHKEERQPKRTSIGYYRPTNLRDVRTVFDILYHQRDLRPMDIFADAGGGDGRVAALASLYGARACSIEGDRAMYATAIKRRGELIAQGILDQSENNNGPWLVEGDFLDPATYLQQLHITPHAVDIFFNAGDNEQGLARLIKSYGKEFANLILMQSSSPLLISHLPYASVYRDDQQRYLATIYGAN
ncbi:hypothetical protein HZC31_05455 [Candidatus Woesearchaeota archaeon]|nr:hypothetical protein [Candidatus Woesearchaeota archaeon]